MKEAADVAIMTAPRHADPSSADPSADDDGHAAFTAADELLLLLPPRPIDAKGTFLRILSLCDSYTMEHYPRVRTAALAAKRMAEADEEGCVVLTVHSGDFLSPSPLTSLDFGMCGAATAACSTPLPLPLLALLHHLPPTHAFLFPHCTIAHPHTLRLLAPTDRPRLCHPPMMQARP